MGICTLYIVHIPWLYVTAEAVVLSKLSKGSALQHARLIETWFIQQCLSKTLKTTKPLPTRNMFFFTLSIAIEYVV